MAREGCQLSLMRSTSVILSLTTADRSAGVPPAVRRASRPPPAMLEQQPCNLAAVARPSGRRDAGATQTNSAPSDDCGSSLSKSRVSRRPLASRSCFTSRSSYGFAQDDSRENQLLLARALPNSSTRSCTLSTCLGRWSWLPDSRMGISLSNSGPECDPVMMIRMG